MKVELIASTPMPETLCGTAAAICTDSDHPERSLKHALAGGHTGVLEHAVFTFRVSELSRAALAQLTRHRLASFDVQSQRYVKLTDWTLVMPASVASSPLSREAENIMLQSMDVYERLLEAGVPAEDARYVTPQAVTTDLIMTMNARELSHFFALRTCHRAQWEIRELADEMLRICRKVAPSLFDGCGPGCVRGRCPEEKPCGHPRKSREWDDSKGSKRQDGQEHQDGQERLNRQEQENEDFWEDEP